MRSTYVLYIFFTIFYLTIYLFILKINSNSQDGNKFIILCDWFRCFFLIIGNPTIYIYIYIYVCVCVCVSVCVCTESALKVTGIRFRFKGSFFHGISTFVDYLMTKPSTKKKK